MWHFEYNLESDPKNRMMFGKVYGVWKLGTAREYATELKETAQPLIKKPWAKLIDLTNWKSAYHDAFPVLGEVNRWCRKNNMEWTVYIINQSGGFAQLMKMMNSAEFSDIGKTFRTKEEGEQFLIEKGYNARNENNNIFK